MSLISPPAPDGVRRLAIIGGRLEDDNRAVYREMRRLSGGRILVFPTASSEPEEVGEETRAAFATHGFKVDLENLTAENAETAAFDPAVVERVKAYGSVYFTGGDQSKIVDALVRNGEETPVLKALRDISANGGLLAGSSAGAAIMSSTMLLGGTSFEAMVHGVTEDPETPGLLVGSGLGFFPHGMVDQHFIKRGRLARLVVAMAHAKQKRGFGVDENTALIVEGDRVRVTGEYGVLYIDLRRAEIDIEGGRVNDIRLSYLDDGDGLDLRTFAARPGESKRRVRRSEVAYRAPARSQRNAFGAYAIYDLIARLVLGDQSTYSNDALNALDPKTGVNARVEIRRARGATRCLIATPTDGLRMTAINLRAGLRRERLDPATIADRAPRGARTFGMDLNERSRIILLGSSPVYFEEAEQREIVSIIGDGPVGVLASASVEARRTAEDHVDFFRRQGVEAIDLGVTIDNVEYVARDDAALDRIASMKCLFLCGGNQIRLVETLLHRGEESAVLRAVARAYANGAALVASSGAVSALSAVMIAGGSSYEALRYGVASDLGHQGLVIQEGVGLFASGIADQNIITARRLGRLVVACAEENERFGIGVCEESAVIAVKSGQELTGAGRHGFVTVETDPGDHDAIDDRFVARGVKLSMYGPGDRVNLASGHVTRASATEDVKATFDQLLHDLMREGLDLGDVERKGRDPSARHAVKLALRRDGELSATLDLECAREEHD
ncbi:MAG: cyanophycinase [Parvularculaceae bacterium]